MFADRREVGIGSFACAFGDVECKPEHIPDFHARWQAVSPGTDFTAMGCATYRRMSAPIAGYVVDAIRRTLQDAAVSAADVDHIVFATSESTRALLSSDFAIEVLNTVGLVDCVPYLVSFQRCCGSLTALRFARLSFADPDVTRVIVVSVDSTADDRDRLQSYAVFSDAAVSCLLSDRTPGLVRLVSSAMHVDQDGLSGSDTFVSRQKVSARALSVALRAGGLHLDQVTKVFGANLHRPLTLFNATSAGIQPGRLHFVDTLAAYGHCGNSDWMINLVDYHQKFGIHPGEIYLAQSSAQGFYGCALLEGSSERTR